MSQLDGLETLTGIFRVRLVETNNRTDYKLQAWVERHALKMKRDRRNSKLMKAFLDAGHSEEELDRRLDSLQPLDDYERDLLEKGEIEIEKSRRFLELAKALVGRVKFNTLAGECKADVLEGRKATKNPTARLIWRVIEAIREGSFKQPGDTALKDGDKLRELFRL